MLILKATFPPPPINPNTNMNIKGKAKLKTTAEGLRKTALKLALVIASIACSWLYLAIYIIKAANLFYYFPFQKVKTGRPSLVHFFEQAFIILLNIVVSLTYTFDNSIQLFYQ